MFSATELHQLIKVPELMKHFHEHRQADKTLGFLGFLQLHYTANHPQDNDDDDDNELPFKDLNAVSHVDNSVSFSRLEHRSCPEFPVISEPISHPEGMPHYRANAVFHPPKA